MPGFIPPKPVGQKAKSITQTVQKKQPLMAKSMTQQVPKSPPLQSGGGYKAGPSNSIPVPKPLPKAPKANGNGGMKS